jgi:prevent-host-death family protein
VPVTTLTSREFHQNSAKVKRAAENGPVIITDRGKPSLVVLTYEEYEREKPPRMSVADALASNDTVDFEQYLPKRRPPREVEL